MLVSVFATASSTGQACLQSHKLPSMGSVFELQLDICKKKFPTEQLLKIQEHLDEIEAELSLYQLASPMNTLNKQGHLHSPGKHMLKLFRSAREVYESTNGAFDVTILPALKLIQDSFRTKQKPPSLESLSELKSIVGMKHVFVDEADIRFKFKNMAVTFDGIAKGYAVDEIAQILDDQGQKNYLINFSGNMFWRGRRDGKSSWRLAVWNPISRKGLPIQNSTKGAIASSSSEHNFYSQDKKWHHIIDPVTLRPPELWAQTTVLGPSALICDALSTAFFTLPESKIREVLKKHFSEYTAWLISSENNIIKIRNQ